MISGCRAEAEITLDPLLTCDPKNAGDRGRSDDRAAAVATADIRLGVLQGDSESCFIAEVKRAAEAGNTAPNQARLVIHVYILRIKDVAW